MSFLRPIWLAVLLLLAATAARAQSIDIGVQGSGDRDRGYKAITFSMVGRGIFKIGNTAIEGSLEYALHAPKIAGAPPGKTLTTDVLVRHYLLPNMYAVAGIDISALSSALLDTTATAAATGLGVEIGATRIQGMYEPPDFTSGQSLSGFRADVEYKALLNRFLPRVVDSRYYVSFRWKGRVSRFERGVGAGTLTGERFEMVIAIGRSF